MKDIVENILIFAFLASVYWLGYVTIEETNECVKKGGHYIDYKCLKVEVLK